MSDNFSQDVAIRGEGNIVVGRGDVIINPLPPTEARLRHDLGILLKNVQNTWIRGVLEKSVHQAALLELGMELREEAVDNPWRMVMEGPGQTPEILPRGKRIKNIFYEANGLLLILGEPGSGKTTTLLQLARDLIAEVDQTFTEPIPVIFNLSTWVDKRQSLDEWLLGELNSKYRLPKKDGRRWLKERRILPLLDGLDEVRAENRMACVEKINQLIDLYGLQRMVVCSRVREYTELNVRLAFYRAIYLQPLTAEQIDEYLKTAGEKLASLHVLLQADKGLRNMAQSPLILNIMSLAYQNTSVEDLSEPSLATDEDRRQHLFDIYIARMFSRKGQERPYDDDRTKKCLSWLARNMQQHNQEVFLIEHLQPSWLSARISQSLYLLASRLISGLSLGFGVWLVLVRTNDIWWPWLITGLSVSISEFLRFEWLRKRRKMTDSSLLWHPVVNIIVIGLIIGLIVGLADRPPFVQSAHDVWPAASTFGLFFGLIFGLRSSKQSPEIDIQTVEALSWSWGKSLKGGLIGGIIGLFYGSILYLNNPGIYRLSILLGYALESGLIFGVLGIIVNGLRPRIMETKSTPNKGIRLSMRNAIIVGLVIAGIAIGINLLGGDLGRSFSVIFALGLGLIFVLWYGGLDVIQHYTLRIFLLIQGHTPGNYAHFLNYTVDRIFLQKVGGGYRFIHRLLLEHFAELSPNGKDDSLKTSS